VLSPRPAAAGHGADASALPPTILGGDGLVLRPWRADDAPALVAIGRDPLVLRWSNLPHPYTRADAEAYLERCRLAWADATAASFAITDRGAVVGSIDLQLRWRHLTGRLGYMVLPGVRGRRIAPRAVRLVTDWALGTLALERVEALVATGNDASRRAAERAGLRFEGVLRRAWRGRDGSLDVAVYAAVPARPAGGVDTANR
jgi:RimJ/RimL family protein N-acetyltransferase